MASHGKNFVDFNNFAETTSFVGIIQAHRGSRNAKVFWAVLLVATFSATLYSVVDLVGNYCAEETVTNSFLLNNDSIILPDPAICLRFYAVDLWRIVERLHLNNTSLVRKYLQYLHNQIGTNDAISWIETNAFNATWLKQVEMQSFITLSTIMFLSLSVTETRAASRMLNDEVYFNTITDSLNFTWSISMDYGYTRYKHAELYTSIAEVRNFILQNMGNWMKVREIVALAWLMNTDVELYRLYGNEARQKIHSGNPTLTWFGAMPFVTQYQNYYSLDFGICFRIANAETFFTFGLSHGFWLRMLSSSLENVSVQAVDIMFSKDRGPTQTNLVMNTATFDRADVEPNILVRLGQRHVAQNLRRKPCLSQVTQFDCRMHCQSNFLQQYCGCVPLSFQWGEPRDADSFCGLAKLTGDASVYVDDYSLPHLYQLQSSSKQFLDCFESCVQDCVTTTLYFKKTSFNSINGRRGMSVEDMAYTEYHSKMRVSTSDFVANLGGIVGLWNGACMLSYVHCVMWILQWVFYKYLKRPTAILISDTKKNEQPSANSFVNIHMTEFVETTGFVGIAQAYDRKKVQRIVWIILIISSQCATLYYVATQALFYLKENVASTVSINNNYGMDLPTPTFCLFPQISTLMLHAKEFKLDNQSYIQNVLRQYDNVDVPNMLLQNARDENFITKHATFIALATNVFFQSAYIESVLSSALLVRSTSSVANYLSEFNACYTEDEQRNLTDSICNFTLLVKDYIVDHNIDLVQLRNTLTYVWLSQLNLTFNRPGDAGLLQLTNASQVRTSWFGYEPMHYDSYYRICFQIDDNHAYLKLADSSVYITATTKPMAPFANTNNSVISTMSLVFATGRTEQLKTKFMSMYFEFEPPLWQHVITYLQTYKSLSTSKRPCSTSTTHLDLTGACVAQFFVENCNCFPFSWLWDGVLENHAHAPLCGFMANANRTNTFLESDLQQCLNKLTANYDKLQTCISRCSSECEFNRLQLRPEGKNTTQEELFRTKAHQFIAVIEQVDRSVVDIIADLGGIIGVWNGAVAMTYIHIIVFLVQWLATYCGYKRLQTSVSNVLEATYGDGISAQVVKEFVETTSFAGVVYACQSRTRFERVFWTAMLCLFFTFTVQNVCQQVQQYQAQDTLTEATVARSSEITLPNPVICLCTKSKWLSSTVNDSRQYIDLTDINTVDKTLTKLRRINVTKWLLSETKDTLEHKAFLLLATCALFDLAANEPLLGGAMESQNWSSVCSDTTNTIVNTAINLSVAKTLNFLKNKNLDFTGLRHALTARWVKEMKIGGTHNPTARPSVLSHEDFETTWLGPDPFQIIDRVQNLYFSICFRLHDGRQLFRFADDQDGWLWLRYNFTDPLISSVLPFSIILSFVNARAYSSDAIEATAEVATVNGRGFYVTIDQEFTFINLPNRRCMSGGTNFDCRLSCISSYIRKYCGCVALSYLWENLNPREEFEQMPLCGVDETTSMGSCRQRFPNTSADAIRTCQQLCPRDCTITSVTVNKDPVGNRFPYYINIKPASFRYVQFNEVFSMTRMDLWNNIGGILGVWTGACLLSYIHAVIFVVNLIWLKFRQCNKIRKYNYTDAESRF